VEESKKNIKEKDWLNKWICITSCKGKQYKEDIQRDRGLITDIKITTDGVRLRKIDKNGKQSEVLVNWEEISDYIKKIFDDY